MSNQKEDQLLEQKEKKFMARMERICMIDKELQNLVTNYNEGLECLAVMKFENSELGDRISSNSFTVGPAFTLVEDTGKSIKLVKNKKNPYYFEEETRLKEELEWEQLENLHEDEPEENLEVFRKRMMEAKKEKSKTETELTEVKKEILEVKEDEIYNRFGTLTIPPRIYAAKRSFDKILDNIVALVNELRSLHSIA